MTMTADVNPVPAEPVSRFERKFPLDFSELSRSLARLRMVCIPDPQFPGGQVNSLYFDTAGLEQYHRSDDGEYSKDKVRLRWYGNSLPSAEMVPLFLEVKQRRGFAGSKRRVRFEVPAEKLVTGRLAEGIMPPDELLRALAGLGYFPQKPLRPVIRVSYQRQRFNEILTGTRVSFDEAVRGLVVAPDLLPGKPDLLLPGGVIEIKGHSLEIPGSLRRRLVPGIHWSRFSKYGLLLDLHFGQNGRLI